MKPVFSIIVACCDVAPYVRECLDSVRNQPFAEWECLVGVEESRDGTLEIVRECTAGDSRFTVLTGPRTGSCSATRNTGIDRAQGDYIVFLDGDDRLAEDALGRLAKRIAESPDADLYPCSLRVYDVVRRRYEEPLDNFPPGERGALSGAGATIVAARYRWWPTSQMQMSVYRRGFLLERGLRCIHGLRGQDREFTPRALYLAGRVVPLHEPIQIYNRYRSGSVVTSVAKGELLADEATIFTSLLAFYEAERRRPGFNPEVAACWARWWTTLIFHVWFRPERVASISREWRAETLRRMLRDGSDAFAALSRHSASSRCAAFWVRAFAGHPLCRPIADLFFRLYFRRYW